VEQGDDVVGVAQQVVCLQLEATERRAQLPSDRPQTPERLRCSSRDGWRRRQLLWLLATSRRCRCCRRRCCCGVHRRCSRGSRLASRLGGRCLTALSGDHRLLHNLLEGVGKHDARCDSRIVLLQYLDEYRDGIPCTGYNVA
jgi:hypothetical protein